MPTRTISRDLKARIPVLFYQQEFSVQDICGLLDIKKSLAYQTLSYAHESSRTLYPFYFETYA
jgi:hypothetical protein